MTHAHLSCSSLRRVRAGFGASLVVLVVLSVAGGARADDVPTLGDATKDRLAGGATAPAPTTEVADAVDVNATADAEATTAEDAAAKMAETWGIEVTSIRMTANDHMIDFRYRVLDPDKAASLFERQTKPKLIDEKSGKVLVVPDTAKIGPLRNSDIPKAGKIYWMFFGNGGNLVRTGDKVTVVIGEFRAEDLVVE